MMSILKTVGKIVVIVSLSLMTIFSVIEYALGQGYEIDEEAAHETVDRLKTDGISLIQILSRMVHTGISGSIDTFYQQDVDDNLVLAITIIITVVILFTIALKVGNHATKVALIIIVIFAVLFMAMPVFQPMTT